MKYQKSVCVDISRIYIILLNRMYSTIPHIIYNTQLVEYAFLMFNDDVNMHAFFLIRKKNVYVSLSGRRIKI